MMSQHAPDPEPPASGGGGREESRRAADWYELFFDLVFVVVIAVSATLIEVDPSPGAVLVFLLLFFPLWWAWVNLMVTNNLFGVRFPAVGALVVAAMPGAAAMAVATSGGIAHDGWLYAAGAAWIRLVLLVMWFIPHARKAISTPLWRLLVYNLGTAAVWLVSIAVPAPYRYILWAAAVAVEVLLLAVRTNFSSEVYERASVSHALERVGLFVVIVIGEAVYLGVTGLAGHPTLAGGGAALAGFLVCALLARAFFRWGIPTAEAGLVAAQRAGAYRVMRDVVLYLPFLLVSALTLIAASIGVAVGEASAPMPPGARALLASGVAGFYLANAIIGVRLGRSIFRILLLLIPGLVLPAVACLVSGGLPAWATPGLVAVALILLDVVSAMLAARAHHTGDLHGRA